LFYLYSKRHGALCLIANFVVATGQVIEPIIGPTRTEEDFVAHIQRIVDTDPTARWVFVTDQLNTHMSEGLVRFVGERCVSDAELGTKRKEGILQTMPSRKEFLEDPSHRIRFIFTPKHTAWMNQIEIGFGILARRVLKRGSFASLEQLRERLLDFITYCALLQQGPREALQVDVYGAAASGRLSGPSVDRHSSRGHLGPGLR